MSSFRSAGFWKETMMTLPDSSFFELIRTVFGKIKTPFNKQVLMGDLEKFLLRDDIKKNIAGYIDENDARIIAAIAVLNEPVSGDLESFFSGEINPSDLRDMVINLEERFVIYRFVENEEGKKPGGPKIVRGPSRLALNPVLKSILSPFAADRNLLFPSVSVNEIPKDETAQNNFLFDDRILAALLSFVSQNSEFFRVGGGVRQKVEKAAVALFPGLSEAGLPLETLVGGLQVLGLFFAEEETLVPDYQRFNAFGTLTPYERLAYCTAGILCYTDFKKETALKEGSPSKEGATSREGANSAAFSAWLFRPKVHNYAEIINRLYESLDPQRLYPHATLQKMAYITEQKDPGRRDTISNVIAIMEKTGLLVPVSDTYWRKALFNDNPHSEKNAVIVMDSHSTILVYPEIAYNDVIALAAFSGVIETSLTVRFELSRDSAVAAFNCGFSAEAIIELLQRLSHNRIDENISFTLNDWEKRHGEVTLQKGLVLTLSPQQSHLAQTKPLAKLIAQTLAPGVYLLPVSEEENAVQALTKAGVAIIARRGECSIRNKVSGSGESGLIRSFFPPFHTTAPRSEEHHHGSRIHFSAPALIESFRSILDKLHLGKEEREELSARIDRRLVLCDSQLKDAIVRYEKLEARGLDYAGKAMIAKQALTMQSPVEVIWPGKHGQENVIGLVKALEKKDNDTVLVIEPLGGADEDSSDDTQTPGNVRIPLGKISLLRRIKKSIFEGG